jgi:serine/threonine-protein kinase RsbW
LANGQEVLLRVPALPEFLRVARVTASGLATRIGFSLDEVDDLRLALDELCYALIGKGDGGGELELRYTLDDSSLQIHGSAHAPIATDDLTLGDFSRQILTALVDEHNVWSSDDTRHFSLTKRQASIAP